VNASRDQVEAIETGSSWVVVGGITGDEQTNVSPERNFLKKQEVDDVCPS